MTEMERLAAPLAAALAGKGYATLTPVQRAVLAEGLAGRDLLVSAQTGSGKTVAFGLAVAPDLLGDAAALPPAGRPLALVIAPTRELALQVRREFDWLYAAAGAVTASCVGGMDYRTERRALDRGAHVVVGTPGRLRDHIERGSLDLAALRAVVLDEADEMLDLGFREDLEFILAAAPADRRTLLFSATVPAAIAELAQAFQRDAARVVAGGEAAQHADIAYRAYSVAPRDREGAIFNLLRFHEARAALVFCKTRLAVNHLCARMGNRGFRVVALSGELTQEERTRALQALRDGRARVCIATDVAARGIDLPGLDLVIHADLPANAETLLHRSGRTGRAGAKGISALVVAPAEFRKASRLLREAKVTAEWGPPPSADEVAAREDERLMEHPALDAPPGDEAAMAEAILTRYGAEQVAAAFVRLWREGRAAPEVLSDAATAPPPAAPKPRGEFGPAVWFRLPVGHEGRAEARWLLPKLCDAGGIDKAAVGAIRVRQAETFVQVSEAAAGRFADGMEIGPGLALTRLSGAPDLGAPPRRTAAPDGAGRPRRPWAPRPEGGAGSRAGRDDRPPARADGGRPQKPRAAKGDRAPGGEGPRAGGPHAGGPRPEGPRAEGPPWPRAARDDRPPRAADPGERPRQPWAPNPDRARAEGPPVATSGATGGERPRPEGGRKPWAAKGDRPPRPPAAATDRPRETAAPATGGAPASGAPRKPRWKGGRPAEDGPGGPAGKPRSAGYKSHGGGEGKKSWGSKSHGGEGRPFKPRAAPKPAAPPPDPRDTSRRFVPPKPPKPPKPKAP
jgi:ATP-dependent RNA helicase DeaD